MLTCMFLLFVGGAQQHDGKLFLSYADILKRLQLLTGMKK
jgi:hypothetical protein